MSSRFALSIAAALFNCAAPAHAEEAKTRAILGGESKLASILAQQSAIAPAAAVTSRSIPVVPSILRESAVPAGPVSADRPDVFGSVAIPMRTTALDHRWNAVAQDGVNGAAAGYAGRVR